MARLLFVKTAVGWPRVTGHDVHGFHLMKALGALGHTVALVTRDTPSAAALVGLEQVRWVGDAGGQGMTAVERSPRLTRLQRRFSGYYGIEPERMAGVSRAAAEMGADAVVAVGLDVLPLLAAVDGPLRVWYAADEWVWHHLSQVRATTATSWGNLGDAAVKGLYERAFAPVVDRVWVVTEAERRAMQWFAGMPVADVVANGVDAEFYCPGGESEMPNSAIFWGRLDFGPNVQALDWFCRKVWPAVRAIAPGARFTIAGFHPSPHVRALADTPGVVLEADVPDLRPLARRHALVVLPFVSGGGIKNKLLEAASLGKAVLGTPRVCRGLRAPAGLPLVQASSVDEWAGAMCDLWGAPAQRARLGLSARNWVMAHHTWEAAARTAVEGLRESAARRVS